MIYTEESCNLTVGPFSVTDRNICHRHRERERWLENETGKEKVGKRSANVQFGR